jgi:hypothetical protein
MTWFWSTTQSFLHTFKSPPFNWHFAQSDKSPFPKFQKIGSALHEPFINFFKSSFLLSCRDYLLVADMVQNYLFCLVQGNITSEERFHIKGDKLISIIKKLILSAVSKDDIDSVREGGVVR